MNTTKIIERVSKETFKDIVSRYEDRIHISPHAYFPVNNTQKDIYNDDAFKNALLKERPYDIGLQRNGRYIVFYKRKNNYLGLIVSVQPTQLEVVTFINPKIIPNLARLK